MKTIWEANYENNAIRVENTWLNGERLFVNNELQDITKGAFGTELFRHVNKNNGEKLNVKVRLFSDFFSVKCILFIDNKKVSIDKIS